MFENGPCRCFAICQSLRYPVCAVDMVLFTAKRLFDIFYSEIDPRLQESAPLSPMRIIEGE